MRRQPCSCNVAILGEEQISNNERRQSVFVINTIKSNSGTQNKQGTKLKKKTTKNERKA